MDNPFNLTEEEKGSVNPFDLTEDEKKQTGGLASPSSAAGAFARGAERGVVPALGGLAAAGAGAEAGFALGAFGGPLAPITAPVGAVLGGIAGGFGGSWLAAKGQDYALSKAPETWKEKIGLDDRQAQLDQQLHPYASFLGGIAPYAVTMRPGALKAGVLPENPTAFQTIMAHPVTARVFGGAAMGGMEAGQELASGEHPDWAKIGISTGFGIVFNKPTRFGERLTELGARPVRGVLGRPEPSVSPEGTTPSAAPAPAAVEETATRPPAAPLTARDWNETILGQKPPTLAQAGEHTVGPGNVEETYLGTQEKNESAKMAAAQAVRDEREALGEPAPQQQDLHETARAMEPAFARYDELTAQRNTFAAYAADHPESEAGRARLADAEKELAELQPQIQAAYRRASESAAGETAEAPPVPYESSPSNFIVDDARRRLIAAGRPPEEAEAAAHVTAALYQTRASRFGGALGTAEELYGREAPSFRGPDGRVYPPLGAPKINGRPQGAPAEPMFPGEAQINQWKAEAPFKTVDDLMAVAPANQEHLASVASQIAEATGTRWVNPGAKSAARAAEKFASKPYPSAGHMTDTVRGGFGVDVPTKADDVIAQLRQHYDVADEGWVTTPAGYMDRKAIIRFPNGQLGELQFWHPDLFDAKENGGGHQLYEEWRSLPLDDPKRAELAEKMSALYAGVLARLPADWKDVAGSGGSPGNLASNASLESVRADMPTSASSTRAQAPDLSAQASPGTQTQGSPSHAQNLGAISTSTSNIDSQAAINQAENALERIKNTQPSQLPVFSPDAPVSAPQPGAPAGVFMFNPTELNVDAQRFQFKSGGDEYGVTGALRSVQKWDPAKAQSIIVWQQRDGKLFVADGHQRAGLARRLTEQGKGGNIQLPGVLYREADGISSGDIRAIAAVTNIANGSGSALDGAKVLRSRPDLMDESLPLTAGKGQQAASLAHLDDEAFRMVVNDVVPEHYGAVVGQLIPNDGPRQVAAMKALARFEPRNVEEAAALTQRVAQAELAKAHEGAQTSMFGDLETPESTAGEEMRIVGKAIRDLKKDKTLFARVVANAERIEQTGSVIQREAARSVTGDAELFSRRLASDAYSAGPLRQELVTAARELKDGKVQIGEATTRILAALRRAAEDDGPDRPSAGGSKAEAHEYAQSDSFEFEPGAEGLPQALVPGVKPVSLREQLQARTEHPLTKGPNKELGADSLFGDSHLQQELFKTATQAAPPASQGTLFQRDRLPMDQESRYARARELGFDTSKTWYHGARRSDRLVETGKLEPKRSTSGPMPFFTDDPEIASNYARSKADTSLDAPDDYAGWFKMKVPGARKPVDIDRAWYSLDPETRRTIAERLPDIKSDEDGHLTYEKGQGFPAGNLKAWNEHYLPREGGGNPLRAAVHVWLTSGYLFGEEQRFLDVLHLAGLKGVEYDSPHAERPGVLPAFIKSQNPLRTDDVDKIQSLLPDLEKLAARSRRPAVEGMDQWAKTSQTVRDFVARLKDDVENGTTYAWTTIPDEITKFLKSKGYDSVLDSGGKGGGQGHNVLIPFEPQQVRSPNAAFDQAKADSGQLLAQGARGKIRFEEGRRPLITIMRDGNASTAIHELGHARLEEMARDAAHEQAPTDVKADWQTVRNWLGADGDKLTVRQHEKFARGFEQYLREGVAPSRQLASVFAKFRSWLLNIYQTLKGLGSPINDDIRGVFDRLLAVEPQRTVITPERAGGPSFADIHETDARETEPHEAEAAADRVLAERTREHQERPPEILNEIASKQPAPEQGGEGAGTGNAAVPGAEDGAGAVGPANVGGDGGRPEPQPGSGGARQEHGAERGGGGDAQGEGQGAPGQPQRGGANAEQHPLAPGPATLIGAAESPFVEKAGNIRLDTLNTTENVKQAIRDSAEANDDFIGDRRGVITDGQVLELADALGMDANTLSRRKLGQAFNAEQIVAARKLLIQSAMNVSETMKKAATGTDEDVMAYAMARDRHQMIQGQVSGITAEAGRALRAFRALAGQETAEGVDQFIRSASAKTLFQLREEAKLGATLDTPAKVSKYLADAQKRSFGRMVLEYWVNGLISNPVTHMTYMAGNEILRLSRAVPETAAAALVSRVRQGMGGEAGVRIGEVGAQLKARLSSTAQAGEAALEAVRSGQTTLLPGEKARPTIPFQGDTALTFARNTTNEPVTWSDFAGSAYSTARGLKDAILSGAELIRAGGVEGAPLVGFSPSPLGQIPDLAIRGVRVLPGLVPGGTQFRLPGRMVAAIHSFYRTGSYSMEKAALAFRQASSEGLAGNDFNRRVAELRANPPEELMEQARHGATESTLMGQGSQFVQALGRLTNTPILGFPYLKFVDPFVHIAGSIIDQSIVHRTPVGLLAPEIRADIMGHNGPAAQDFAIGRMLVGTALSITMGGLAAEGYVSGSGPSDPHEAAMWRLAGNQSHSLRIGDMWYDMHKLGPLGMNASVAADLYQVGHLISDGDASEAASHLMHAFTHTIMDESFMRGPADLIKAVEDSDRYGARYVQNMVSSFTPFSVAMGQWARSSDPYSRQARSIMDSFRQKLPFDLGFGKESDLFPRRDIWGEPLPSRTSGVPFTSIYTTQISRDPVNLAMVDLGISPAAPPRKIRGQDLTDQEYDDFSRIAGRMTKMRLDAIVRSPDYGTWPNHIKERVINQTIKECRESARGVLMMKYRHIPSDAAKEKLDALKD